MSERITSLLGDLQRLVAQIGAGNNKVEGRPVQDETRTREPDAARAMSENSNVKKFGEVEDLIISSDSQVAGVVIAVDVDKRNTTALY
jgi:hypothetical protein